MRISLPGGATIAPPRSNRPGHPPGWRLWRTQMLKRLLRPRRRNRPRPPRLYAPAHPSSRLNDILAKKKTSPRRSTRRTKDHSEAVWEDELEDEDEDEESGLYVEPVFVYIVVMLVTALGTSSLASDVRYTVLWSALALTGAASLVIDRLPLDRPSPRDVLAGVAYGLIIGLPLLLVGGTPLRMLSEEMFGRQGNVAVFQAVVFVMPFSEILFFRGSFQFSRGMIAANIAGGAWTVLLFLPALNVSQFPFVALVIGLAFFLANFVYGSLAERLGLVSAWACQVTINVLVLFAARLV